MSCNNMRPWLNCFYKYKKEGFMFVRKKINGSGSYSILLVKGERVAGKKNSVSRTIKNFGSARSEEAINALVAKAEAYKTKLEISSPKAVTLKLVSEMDIKSCRSYNAGFADVYGQKFDAVFSGIDLNPRLLSRLRDLVVMRIATPASKLKTARLAPEYDMELNVDSIYKMMDELDSDVINNTKKTIYSHTSDILAQQKQKIDVLFYDLTTLYFETGTQDELRNLGFSKDGKHQHAQIMLAVIVTTDGLPIDYQEFPGNCFEGHTLIPALDELRKRYDIGKVILVADAALMNKINLQELNDKNIQYVIAARIKNTDKTIKQDVFDIESYEVIGNTTDNDELKAKTITAKNGDKLIAYHSTKRARKDEHDRQKDLQKIEKYLHSSAKSKLTGSLKKPYVKISKSCKIEIDLDKLNIAKQYDGFFGLQTNIKDPNPLEMISTYRGLWQVEQTFRIAKTNLEIRPIFHYTPSRIRAHLVICYMALALIRYVEFTLKYKNCHTPCDRLHELLGKMRKTRIIDQKDMAFEILENPSAELTAELMPIYKALKITWPKKLSNHPVL